MYTIRTLMSDGVLYLLAIERLQLYHFELITFDVSYQIEVKREFIIFQYAYDSN